MTIFHMNDTKLKKIMISEKWNKWKEPHIWLSQFTMTEEFLGHEARIENASKFLKLRIQGECGASVHKTEYQGGESFTQKEPQRSTTSLLLKACM